MNKSVFEMLEEKNFFSPLENLSDIEKENVREISADLNYAVRDELKTLWLSSGSKGDFTNSYYSDVWNNINAAGPGLGDKETRNSVTMVLEGLLSYERTRKGRIDHIPTLLLQFYNAAAFSGNDEERKNSFASRNFSFISEEINRRVSSKEIDDHSLEMNKGIDSFIFSLKNNTPYIDSGISRDFKFFEDKFFRRGIILKNNPSLYRGMVQELRHIEGTGKKFNFISFAAKISDSFADTVYSIQSNMNRLVDNISAVKEGLVRKPEKSVKHVVQVSDITNTMVESSADKVVGKMRDMGIIFQERGKKIREKTTVEPVVSGDSIAFNRGEILMTAGYEAKRRFRDDSLFFVKKVSSLKNSLKDVKNKAVSNVVSIRNSTVNAVSHSVLHIKDRLLETKFGFSEEILKKKNERLMKQEEILASKRRKIIERLGSVSNRRNEYLSEKSRSVIKDENLQGGKIRTTENYRDGELDDRQSFTEDTTSFPSSSDIFAKNSKNTDERLSTSYTKQGMTTFRHHMDGSISIEGFKKFPTSREIKEKDAENIEESIRTLYQPSRITNSKDGKVVLSIPSVVNEDGKPFSGLNSLILLNDITTGKEKELLSTDGNYYLARIDSAEEYKNMAEADKKSLYSVSDGNSQENYVLVKNTVKSKEKSRRYVIDENISAEGFLGTCLFCAQNNMEIVVDKNIFDSVKEKVDEKIHGMNSHPDVMYSFGEELESSINTAELKLSEQKPEYNHPSSQENEEIDTDRLAELLQKTGQYKDKDLENGINNDINDDMEFTV